MLCQLGAHALSTGPPMVCQLVPMLCQLGAHALSACFIRVPPTCLSLHRALLTLYLRARAWINTFSWAERSLYSATAFLSASTAFCQFMWFFWRLFLGFLALAVNEEEKCWLQGSMRWFWWSVHFPTTDDSPGPVLGDSFDVAEQQCHLASLHSKSVWGSHPVRVVVSWVHL